MTLPVVQPDLKWYAGVSAARNVAPRCPFASVHRCPRYYASVSMLGEWGIATRIDPKEDKRLFKRWKRSDLWPVVAEEDTGITGAPGKPSMFSKFCPEVSFERFGWFASLLAYYADEIDMGVAHRNLARQGATGSDWRWGWAAATPMHYSECPLYSPLANTLEKADMRSAHTILQRYRQLGLWGKLAAWGSLASIIGLGLFFLPPGKVPAKSQANTVTGGPGATILQSGRDIVIGAAAGNPQSGTEPTIKAARTQPAPLSTVNNCPNGICISGGDVSNPTVINNGPPPPSSLW